MTTNQYDRVWVYAQHTVRAGKVVRSRYEDFASEPHSDDYIVLDGDTAKVWAKSNDPFTRKAGLNALDYLGYETDPS